MAVVIGVDIGTTSTKAGAYRLDGSAVCTASVETRLYRHGPGHVEQSPQELLDSAYAALAGCVARGSLRPDDVVAIAFCGQMAGVMGIDVDGSAVTPYDSWLDSRCAPQMHRLAAEHGDLLVERTGCPPMLDHAPKMLWWHEERPDDYARIAAFVVPAVFVAMRMGGLAADAAFVDPSYLHFTGLADGRAGRWSAELAETLGLDAEKLPRIVEAATVVGELTAEAAQRCGLVAGTPIAAGLGDTAAGVLGAGIVHEGQLLDTAGTAAVLVGSVRGFAPDPQHGLIVMRGVMPGQYLPLNYVAGGGLCIPWLLELTRHPGVAERAEALDALLSEAADVPPGCEGLLFVPHVEGRIAPHDPEMRGGWLGLSLAHRRGHLARAMLEAIAFEYATYLHSIRRLHPEIVFSEMRAIGGGARSRLWNQIKSDVLGVSVARVAADETATRGAALVAARAVGLIDDLATVATAVPIVDRVEPDADRHATYRGLIDRYAVAVDLVARHHDPRNPNPKPERQPVA